MLGFINKTKVSKIQKVILTYSALAFSVQHGFRSVLLKSENSNKEGLEIRKMQPTRRLKELVLLDQEKKRLKADKITFKYGTFA